MTPAEVLNQARAAGVVLWAERDALRYRGPREVLTAELLESLKAHKAELLVALAAEDLREHFEERAAILEHDAGLPRPEAELEAVRITATLARNRRYTWESLRSALSGYSALLSQLPDRAGKIDSLPFGAATVHARKDRRVVRQGSFTGTQEVKA